MAEPLSLLSHGKLEIVGRLVDASNATLYAECRCGEEQVNCVYKPVSGERPLWDFPDGTLANRELAAYLVSEAIGWQIVPPTVYRDGPFGPGMVQLWIDADPEVDLVALARSDHPGLRRMAVFDAVVNNSDRKGGHLLPTPDGHVYGVDHGVCFSVEDKLRTILWRWRGQRLLPETLAALTGLQQALASHLGQRLAELLTSREVAATERRLRRLIVTGRHPQPAPDWPAVPWPPF